MSINKLSDNTLSKTKSSSINANLTNSSLLSKKFDYRHELVLYFYNQILVPYVVEEFSIIEPPPVEKEDRSKPQTPQEEVQSLKKSTSQVEPADVISELEKIIDLEKLSAGSKVSLSDSKRRKSGKRKSSKLSEKRGSKLKTINSPLPVIDELARGSASVAETRNDEYESHESTSFDWFVPDVTEHVNIKFKNGALYAGPLVKKLMHGNGILHWSDGTRYEGSFINGYITGTGILTYPDLSYYTGQFCKGALHGTGTYNPSGSKILFAGEWKDGKKNGKGWLYYGPGNYYEGEWLNDRKHGKGFRRYYNGTIYNGEWYEGRMHGKGTLLYSNNDFYKGEFKDGLAHGYGEYTWNASLCQGLSMPLENIYQGTWSKGKRDGMGMIHFGMEGSKLAACFKSNKKDGAGIMVCGDGTIIEKQPLFIEDVPIHTSSQHLPFTCRHPTISLKKLSTGRKSTAPVEVPGSVLSLPTINRLNTLFEPVEPRCTPLKIPIHGNILQIDLSYHIIMLFNDWHKLLKSHNSKEEDIDISKNSTHNDIECEFEERKLRNMITLYYHFLECVYKTYASLTSCPSKLKPIMSRLFLWQFYKDIKVDEIGLSLVDTDLLLLQYENSALESKHYPFERIYFWQFLHSIMNVMYKKYFDYNYVVENRQKGVLATMLENFIEAQIRPNHGRFDGNVIFKYKHLLPINAVYRLYTTLVDEDNIPTVRDLLKRTCFIDNNDIPCRLLLGRSIDEPLTRVVGVNYVCTGTSFVYLPHKRSDKEFCERRATVPEKLYPLEKDIFFNDLRLFRKLGPRKIVNFASKICPFVKCDKFVVCIDQRLTFLEFYEILILAAEELLEMKRIEEERRNNPVVETPKIEKKTKQGKKAKGKK